MASQVVPQYQALVTYESKSENISHSVVSDSLLPHGPSPSRLLCPWDFPGKHTGRGSHSLFQGIMVTNLLMHPCTSCPSFSVSLTLFLKIIFFPGKENGNPLQYSYLGNPWRGLAGYVHHKELDMT